MKRVLMLLAIIVTSPAIAAPQADLWERWTASDQNSTLTVDHSVWDRFLKTYVVISDDGIARVRYGTVSSADKDTLNGYISNLSLVPVTKLQRAEQRAFWINLYNALTVQVVLVHYPVDTIRDIRTGIFSPGPWGLRLVAVEGEDLTLDDIEHRILRPGWGDPRLHYALNCASLGCPNLLRQAFTVANTENLLEEAARSYVNHPRGVMVDGGIATVSKIYDWFESDFGGNEAGVVAHLSRYAEPSLAAALRGRSGLRYQYDWDLNDAGAN